MHKMYDTMPLLVSLHSPTTNTSPWREKSQAYIGQASTNPPLLVISMASNHTYYSKLDMSMLQLEGEC